MSATTSDGVPVPGTSVSKEWSGLLRALVYALGGVLLMPILMQQRELLSAVKQLGTTLCVLAVVHAFTVLLGSRAWLTLTHVARRSDLPSRRYFWVAALIRETIASGLPIGGVSAPAAAMRMMETRRVPKAEAVASLVVEGSLALLALVVLAVLAIGTWLCVAPLTLQCRAIFAGLTFDAVVILAVKLVVDNNGPAFGVLVLLLRHLGRVQRTQFWIGALDTEQEIERIYSQPWASFKAAFWQFAALSAAVTELWLMLSLLNVPDPLVLALSLCVSVRAARGLSTPLPAGLGIQEVAFGGVLVIYGLDFSTGVAVAIATRAKDLLLGLPVLLSWTELERGRRHTLVQPRNKTFPYDDGVIKLWKL